jgi:hypothetical protein
MLSDLFAKAMTREFFSLNILVDDSEFQLVDNDFSTESFFYETKQRSIFWLWIQTKEQA